MSTTTVVNHFRSILKCETDKLEILIEKWSSIKELDSIPEEAWGHINSTKGQALLLINQRFKQFNTLINDCEHNTGFKEITGLDLQGFWDMIYFQVEDVIRKFDKLDVLKENNWTEKTYDVIKYPMKANNKIGDKKLFKTNNKTANDENVNKTNINNNNKVEKGKNLTKSTRSTSALRSHIMKARAQVARSNSAGELLIISESMKENKTTSINSPTKVNTNSTTTTTTQTKVNAPPPLSPVVTVSENSIPVVEKENKVTITVTKTEDIIVKEAKEMNGNHAEKETSIILLEDSLKSKPV